MVDIFAVFTSGFMAIPLMNVCLLSLIEINIKAINVIHLKSSLLLLCYPSSDTMPIKKSELYSSLWKSCDELRGGMDASQYKDYVLVLLFVKYVSDKYAGQPDALIEVPLGGSFADMAALKGVKDIGDQMNKIIGRLAEANDLTGVINHCAA